jgi:hypothetical protein
MYAVPSCTTCVIVPANLHVLKKSSWLARQWLLLKFLSKWFDRDFPLEKKTVIPAKAGIQSIKKRLRSRSTLMLCPLRGLFFLLDSRLRGITSQMPRTLGLSGIM